MISPLPILLPDGHPWLRVADETWDDPLEPSFAQQRGGRWNQPNSFPVLYLNEDLPTARAQIERMLSGYPVEADDLDPPFVLITVSLPRNQTVADAVTNEGLVRLGLPATYPVAGGKPVLHKRCRKVGAAVRLADLRGVRARSAATRDGSGAELAWFPARRTSKARRAAPDRPFSEWW